MTYFPSTKLQNSTGTVINPATEDTLLILAHATGTAGSPSATALTIQGISGGTPVMVSAAGGFGGSTVGQGASGATAWPVSISGALPSGTNSLGDIGNITTSITPGSAAANLGKKINTADDTTNDIGVAIYGIRRDDGALFGAAASNRFAYFSMDSNSHVWLAGSYRDNQAGGTYQASGNYQAASGSVMAIGGVFDESATAVNASAVGYLRMNSRREQIVAQGSVGATAWPVSVSGTAAISGTVTANVASIANVTANQGSAGATAWPINVSAWMGATGATLGQKTHPLSIPVVLAGSAPNPAKMTLSNVEVTEGAFTSQPSIPIIAWNSINSVWQSFLGDSYYNIFTLANLPYVAYNHTFSATGTDASQQVPLSAGAYKYWSLQVVQTGGVTAWDVQLQGSLDGTNFVQTIRHTNTDGSGAIINSSSASPTVAPCSYFRLKCSTMTGGTSLACYMIGIQ